MSRSLAGTDLRNAIDINGSYYSLIKAEVFPSRIYFEEITSNYPVSGADAIGIVDDPMPQDIEYSLVDDLLVTFYVDATNNLMWAKQGSTSGSDTGYDTAVKPGVLGSKLYIYNTGGNLRRYSINWSTMGLSQDISVSPPHTVSAVHAVSDTEAIAIYDDEGGFRPMYLSGTTMNEASMRFMFPSLMISSGSARTMDEVGISSGAARLGDKIFVYMSNHVKGFVEGMYYDLDTGAWSDPYIALPTDMAVSQCEFRITNVYEYNDMLYMCGQFNRLDNMSGGQPYSLILTSVDGKTFSLDRFTLVSNIGYRFLARVGNGNLYLGNSNRICKAPLTWYFDGTSGSGAMVEITGDDIKGFQDRDLNTASLTLRSGLEQYFDDNNVKHGSRIIVYLGMKTANGDEYVKYGTYIINEVVYQRGPGRRGTQVNCMSEAMWKLSGLSMPFYAELLGKSVYFDPMLEDTSELTSATFSSRTVTQFQTDFWKQEPYSSGTITGIDMVDGGGVNYYGQGEEDGGAHHYGIVHNDDIMDIFQMENNPLITSGSVLINVHGWSHPHNVSEPNDTIRVLLITEDEDGNETEQISTDSGHWKITYPYSAAGEDPIPILFTGLEVGHRIKKAGVTFQCANPTYFNIARLDFMSGVEAAYSYEDGDTPWEKVSDGSFRVPGSGRPYIMYSQRPYHTDNFSLAAFFCNTTTGQLAGFPTAAGLVGLAENGANYVLARYNKTNSKVELIKCRNGIETELDSATPGFSIYDEHFLRFDHKGGRFEIFMVDASSGSQFESVLVYEWQAADGYMFTSDSATMKCGIYGNISSPCVRTLGYYGGQSDDASYADGLGIDPLADHSSFPESGKLRMGDDIYTYASKIAHPTLRRGPYQYRQGGLYTPPWGTGDYGLECRDFDWLASESLINGKLVTISSGATFIASGADWTIWTTTGGVVSYHYNRARYYSDNEQIGKLAHTLANKVWVVGGFADLHQVNSTTTTMHHLEGDMAYYEISGVIKCYWYMGAGGTDDTTVEDLISQVCGLSAARCSFPGDTSGSLVLSGGESEVISIPYAEGTDLYFETNNVNNLELRTNVKITSTNYEGGAAFENDTDVYLTIENVGSGVHRYIITSEPSGTQMYRTLYQSTTGLQKFRVLWHGSAISLYQNGKWVTTIPFDELVYGSAFTVNAYGTLTMSNIRIKELADWREAVWIDLETDGRSALGSIIQQRAVETVTLPDGSVCFYYEIDRDTVEGVREPRDHKYSRIVPTDGASDAIIFGPLEVKTLQHDNFARELGFATKLFRMPDLTIGATRSAMLLLDKVFEKYQTHNLVIRPDLALVVGDKYHLSYTASGTGATEDHNIILESVTLDLRVSGNKVGSRMNLVGREVYVEPD